VKNDENDTLSFRRVTVNAVRMDVQDYSVNNDSITPTPLIQKNKYESGDNIRFFEMISSQKEASPVKPKRDK
jgi:hypothetical protein